MKKFEEGRTYTAISFCNQSSYWLVRINKRTEKTAHCTVFYKDGETVCDEGRKKIYKNGDYETILPLGNFSMAPCISSRRE